MPPIGGLNIILDSNNNDVCIAETIKVYTCQFCEVSESHAFKEGEVGRSIAYWKTVHKDFFQTSLKYTAYILMKQKLPKIYKKELVEFLFYEFYTYLF